MTQQWIPSRLPQSGYLHLCFSLLAAPRPLGASPHSFIFRRGVRSSEFKEEM
jgi:hypothetical protein